VLGVDNMKASVSGRESLNGAAEPGRDLPEIDVFDGTKISTEAFVLLASTPRDAHADKPAVLVSSLSPARSSSGIRLRYVADQLRKVVGDTAID
jgi:hypothetical protein